MAEDDAFAGIEDVFPATPGQAGMLFETLATPDYPVNRGLMVARLPADLDVARFQDAWAQVIARHQALRSRLLWEGLSEPVLVIENEVKPAWELRELTGPDYQDRLEDLIIQMREGPFDLSQAPTTKQVLVRCPDGFRLLWLMHHGLMDDWSVEVAYRESAALYAGETLPPAMPYRDFADWRAGRDADPYWTDLLAGHDGPTQLGFAAPAGAVGGQPHKTQIRHLPIAPLAEAAREMRVTTGAVLAAAWSLVVQRLSGSEDVTFGLATTERPSELPGAESAMGLFVATHPARLTLDDAATFRDVAEARNRAFIEGRGRLVPLLSELSGEGLPFDTILSIKAIGAGGAQSLYSDVITRSHSSFPLAMIIRPEEEVTLTALYSPDRFADRDIETLLEIFVRTLKAVPGSVDQPACTLAVDKDVDCGPSLAASPLLPGAIAAADADAPALRDDLGTVSYRDLDRLAAAFATQMAEAGVGAGGRVGILLPRGATAVAAFLAAWRLGAAYIPLDPAQPDERLQQMVEAGQADAILAAPAYQTRLAGKVVVADPSAPPRETRHETRPDEAAYVMFTSGSTGVPKGVRVSHGNLAASTAARPVYYADRPDRFMVVSPFGFDSSVAGIYWTLSSGGTLVVPSADEVRDIPALARRIRGEAVTHILCLPSLYDLLLGHAPDLQSLRCVILAGEPVPAPLIARHEGLRPGARLVNEYGPTEATVWCAAAELRADEATVPIGRAIPGAELSVHDGLGRPVPDGIAGELWVGGAGVAGYLGDDSDAFGVFAGKRRYRTGDYVRRRADGQLTYLGRRDAQVKINGQRVELGEVEARLAAIGDVGEVAVIVQSGRLIAFVSGEVPDLDRIEGPMRPSRVVPLDTLPKTATGKVDRKALAAVPLPTETAQVAPETAQEEALAALWQDVLGLTALPDVTADFFALGGTSLAAMRLVAAIAERLGQPVSLPQLLGEGRSIRQLAALMDRQPDATPAPVKTGYPAPASDGQKALWFAAKLRPTEPHFNLAKVVRIDRALDRGALATLADGLIARHPILGCGLELRDRALTVMPRDALPEIVLEEPQDVTGALHAHTRRPFAMDKGLLWRIVALSDGGETVLAVLIHHTIADGWSLDILMEDVAALLMGETLPAPDAAPVHERALTAPPEPWVAMLEGVKAGPRLPTVRPLPERSQSAGLLAQRCLDGDHLAALKTLAAGKGASLFAPLWAATATWLASETGEADTLIAVSHAGRSAPGLARSIGCFTHALPYRLDTAGSFDGLVDRAADRLATIRIHEDVDLAKLPLPAPEAPRGYLTAFTSVALQFNDFDWARMRLPDGVTPVEFIPLVTSYFEVSIEWTLRGDDLICRILAREDIYDQACVEGWLDRLLATAARVAAG
ncbi:MAG: amino acid adenylation domain-containing protein [Pseudomonadota bacterium]